MPLQYCSKRPISDDIVNTPCNIVHPCWTARLRSESPSTCQGPKLGKVWTVRKRNLIFYKFSKICIGLVFFVFFLLAICMPNALWVKVAKTVFQRWGSGSRWNHLLASYASLDALPRASPLFLTQWQNTLSFSYGSYTHLICWPHWHVSIWISMIDLNSAEVYHGYHCQVNLMYRWWASTLRFSLTSESGCLGDHKSQQLLKSCF